MRMEKIQRLIEVLLREERDLLQGISAHLNWIQH
jgi:hypothetical protein